MARVTLNVSGKKFVTFRKTLDNIPMSRLGLLRESSPEYDAEMKEYYFDRDPRIMTSVLNLYRTGELHIPSSMCGVAVLEELNFWDIPEDMISECCWNKYAEQISETDILNILDRTLGEKIKSSESRFTLKETIWLTMEKPFYSTASKIWNLTYLIFVLLAILVFTLSSVKAFRVERKLTNTSMLLGQDSDSANNSSTPRRFASYIALIQSDSHVVLYYLDIACIIFFTLELPLRFTVTPNKCSFFKSFMNLVDLALVMIMWSSFVLDELILKNHQTDEITIIIIVLRSLLSLRILRVFHIARRFDSMKVLFLTYKASVKEISMLFTVLIIAINIFGTLAYFAEVLADRNTFENIPIALWWAIITMTTVGYGDYVPQSFPGYIVGIICALAGLVTLSMPIAIIATNFSAYYSCIPSRKQRIRRNTYIQKHPEKFGRMLHVDHSNQNSPERLKRHTTSILPNGSTITCDRCHACHIGNDHCTNL